MGWLGSRLGSSAMLPGVPSPPGVALGVLLEPLAAPFVEPLPLCPGWLLLVVVLGELELESPQPTTWLPTNRASRENMPKVSCERAALGRAAACLAFLPAATLRSAIVCFMETSRRDL